MTWNIELAITKNDLTFSQIQTLITTLISYDFDIEQMNIRPYSGIEV